MTTPTQVENTAGVDLTWSKPESLVARLIAVALVWALVSLAAALVGWLHWWLVLPLVIGLSIPVLRKVPRGEASWDKPWIIVFVIAAGLTVFNAQFPGEHLYTGRDSGTYLATAGWIAEDGGLIIGARTGGLEGHEDLEFAVAGFYDTPERTTLRPQFMHAYPAMMASVMDVGGMAAVAWFNPLASSLLLLATFALARRVSRKWPALLAVLVFCSSLVFLYYSRAPFSEPLMGVFLVGGIWIISDAEQRGLRSMAVLGGAFLGAATLIRLDGIVLLLPATAYLLGRSSLEPESASVLRPARLAMNVVALIGLAESLLISPAYILGRRSQVVAVLGALIVIYLVNDLVVRRRRDHLVSFFERNQRAILTTAIVAVGLALAAAWLIRPQVSEVTGPSYGIETLQEREGVEIEPDRNYAEMSVVWITWYQGPGFIVLAFAGMVLATLRAREGMKEPTWWVVGVLLVFGILYIWRPSINPDQIWAMRRYLPAVLPLGAVAVGIALSQFIAKVANKGLRSLSVLVLGALVLVPPVYGAAQVWDVHEFDGLAEDFDGLCDDLGPDVSVVVVSDDAASLGPRITQSIRSYCGLPAAWIDGEPASELLDEVDASVSDQGRELRVVRADEEGTYLNRTYAFLEVTLLSRPDGLQHSHSPADISE